MTDLELAAEIERKHKLLFDIETQLSPAHPHYTADRAIELVAHWAEAAQEFHIAWSEHLPAILAALRRPTYAVLTDPGVVVAGDSEWPHMRLPQEIDEEGVERAAILVQKQRGCYCPDDRCLDCYCRNIARAAIRAYLGGE